MSDDAPLLDHPLRRTLNDEVHARPPDDLPTPSSLCYVARTLQHDGAIDSLGELMQHFGEPPPDPGTKHVTATLGNQRLRWERHTEFVRYAFIRGDAGESPFSHAPATDIPGDWLSRRASDVVAAIQVAVVAMPGEEPRLRDISREYFGGNPLIGSMIAGGRAMAVTDFRIPENGFMRLLILNEAMPASQTGRFVQRLLEIDTYRMMALLALPVAQSMSPKLDQGENELVEIYESLLTTTVDDETELLNRLTVLATENQRRHAASDFRFAAATAYYQIVLQRIAELREVRIPGLQTFDEFTTRRLTPAVKTCGAVHDRQQSLVLRMARATQLLSTRIDVERQRQNQQLLESMDRRARSQLRLQATVEGLSVAAVTYYVVGLVAILLRGAHLDRIGIDPALATAVSIPLVAGVAYYGVRRIRRRISEESSA